MLKLIVQNENLNNRKRSKLTAIQYIKIEIKKNEH